MRKKMMLRRSLDEECKDFQLVNTTAAAEDDDHVVEYAGIMFSVRSKQLPLQIQSLELHLLHEQFHDLDVLVYSLKGDYQLGNAQFDQSQWQLVADATAIKHPTSPTAVLIPKFTPVVSLAPYELQSFYVSVDGMWLQSKVHKVDQIADVVEETDQLKLYSGVGLQKSNFASGQELGKNGYPLFTGTVFVAPQHFDCSHVKTTAIAFPFLVDTEHVTEISLWVTSIVNQVMNDIMTSSQVLLGYTRDYKLALSDQEPTVSEEEIPASCPTDWQFCSPLTVHLSLTHALNLDSGAVQYAIYPYAPTVVTQAVKDRSSPTRLGYVGPAVLSAAYEFKLSQVQHELSSVHRDFVIWSLQNYLDNTLELEDDSYAAALAPKKSAQVLTVSIDSQSIDPNDHHHRALLDPNEPTTVQSSLTLKGQIHGLGPVYQVTNDDFVAGLEHALVSSTEVLPQVWQYDLNLPQFDYMSQEESFFEHIAVSDVFVQQGAAPVVEEIEGHAPHVTLPPSLFDDDKVPGDDAAPEDFIADNPGTSLLDQAEDFAVSIKEGMQDVNPSVWIFVAVVATLTIVAICTWCCIVTRKKKKHRQVYYPDEGGAAYKETAQREEPDSPPGSHSMLPPPRQYSDRPRQSSSKRQINGEPPSSASFSLDQDRPFNDHVVVTDGNGRDYSSPSTSSNTGPPIDLDDDQAIMRAEQRRPSTYEAAKHQADQMDVKSLKKELQNMGISTIHFQHKSDLVQAYAQACVDGEDSTEVRNRWGRDII